MNELIPVITFDLPVINTNFGELKAQLADGLKKYDIEVTAENLPEAKTMATDLNKLSKVLATVRKEEQARIRQEEETKAKAVREEAARVAAEEEAKRDAEEAAKPKPATSALHVPSVSKPFSGSVHHEPCEVKNTKPTPEATGVDVVVAFRTEMFDHSDDISEYLLAAGIATRVYRVSIGRER